MFKKPSTAEIKYPFKCPNLPTDLGPSFWSQTHIDFFAQLPLSSPVKRILELGSAWGRSTLGLLDIFPDSTIICIDTFKGSPEWPEFPEFFTPAQQKVLDSERLLDQFIRNTWKEQVRVTILQGSTKDRIKDAAHFPSDVRAGGFNVVDLVYIDASHQEKDVISDIQTCHNYWPYATFVGDDANFNSVMQAFELVSKKLNRVVKVWQNRIWHFV